MWAARALRRGLAQTSSSASASASRALPPAPPARQAARRATGKAAGPEDTAEELIDWRALWSLVKFGAFLHCLHECGSRVPPARARARGRRDSVGTSSR